MLKLKLQYFGHLMRRVDSLEKTLMLGGIGGRRRRGRPRMRWLDGTTDSMDVSLSELQEFTPGRPGVLWFVGSQRVGHDWATDLIWSERKFGLPWWLSGKESACWCRRRRFNPWARKIPGRRKWQCTPVLLSGKSHGQRSLAGHSPWGLRVGHDLETKHHHHCHRQRKFPFY